MGDQEKTTVETTVEVETEDAGEAKDEGTVADIDKDVEVKTDDDE